MNNTQETQEARRARKNRFSKAEATTQPQQGQQMKLELKDVVSYINEIDTALVMLLALSETGKFATNTMGAIQDVADKVIVKIKKHADEIVFLVNETNAISWELSKSIAIAIPGVGEFHPDATCPVVREQDLMEALQMIQETVWGMNCTKEVLDIYIKGALQVTSKIKALLPRWVKLMNAYTTLGETMAKEIADIKVDDHYKGNVFDTKL